MARPTTDPKRKALTVRLNADDMRKLARMARQAKCTKGEVVRRLVRDAKEG